MPLPKAIIFDLGKVLLDFDYAIAARALARQGKVNGDPMRFLTSHSELLRQYETGLITTSAFFQRIAAATGYRGTEEEFGECFGDIFSEIPPMIELHIRLRKAGYPTFIFSNTNELAVRHIRRAFPFYGDFDGYIYSHEHRAMKPDNKLYEVVESRTQCQGPELLYIDDRPENIAAGAQRSWQVILQENPGKTIAAIEALGVFNNPGISKPAI